MIDLAIALAVLLGGAWVVFTEVRLWALEKRLSLLHEWCVHATEIITELEGDS